MDRNVDGEHLPQTSQPTSQPTGEHLVVDGHTGTSTGSAGSSTGSGSTGSGESGSDGTGAGTVSGPGSTMISLNGTPIQVLLRIKQSFSGSALPICATATTGSSTG